MRKKKKVSFALTKSQDAVEEDATGEGIWPVMIILRRDMCE